MASLGLLDGVYSAQRASQLAGVPLSTVHYWARTEVVVPSISPVREKLWSYGDLLALRVVSWLRHSKVHAGRNYPPTPMKRVRRALAEISAGDKSLFEVDETGRRRCRLVASPDGKIVLASDSTVVESVSGQRLIRPAVIDLLAEFRGDGGAVGPDLVAPRPHLRIRPGKLAGEPHLQGSRIGTLVIEGLARQGYSPDQIAELYPQVSCQSIAEAIEFERSLAA